MSLLDVIFLYECVQVKASKGRSACSDMDAAALEAKEAEAARAAAELLEQLEQEEAAKSAKAAKKKKKGGWVAVALLLMAEAAAPQNAHREMFAQHNGTNSNTCWELDITGVCFLAHRQRQSYSC